MGQDYFIILQLLGV